MLFFQHSGTTLLEKTDTNDQTVLHYAARPGNCLVSNCHSRTSLGGGWGFKNCISVVIL